MACFMRQNPDNLIIIVGLNKGSRMNKHGISVRDKSIKRRIIDNINIIGVKTDICRPI